MVRFLTDAWVDALDRAAATLQCTPDVAGATLAIEHVVDTFTYHVRIDGTGVRFVAGPAPVATVRFTADRATAHAIASGGTSAQRAFMDGRLHIDGDALALSRALPALRGLDDAFAAVRAATEW